MTAEPEEFVQRLAALGTVSLLTDTDPTAFAGPDHWWSVVYEQRRGGLL